MPLASLSLPVDFETPAFLVLLAAIPIIPLAAHVSLGGLRGTQRVASIALRCLLVVVLIAALAGPRLAKSIDEQTVVFLMDASQSVPRPFQQAALAFLKDATGTMRPSKDRVGVVTFAKDAQVDQLPGERLEITHPRAPAERDATDLAAALRLAVALFPPDTVRRIVLLSDGNENVGDAVHQAQSAAGAHVPIDVVPLHYSVSNEVLIENVAAPAQARVEESIDVGVVLRAQRPTTGRIRMYHNDILIATAADPSGMRVELTAGANRLRLPATLTAAGAHRFRVVFEPDDRSADQLVENNEGSAVTIVDGPERILLINDGDEQGRTADAGASEALARTLREAGFACDVLRAEEAAWNPATFAPYGGIVLSNVSAASIPRAGQSAIASFVRELGGGLVVLGGDHSFTLGGYQDTPLDDVLPVETSRQKLKLLSLGMVFVIDKSGSMAGEKLDMARQAAAGAVRLLNRLDWVGVIGFDSMTQWISPLARCENVPLITAQIDKIEAGGGTDMYPALVDALAALSRSDANLRHIIVLTDGQTESGDFDGLSRKMKAAGVSCSTIAIGDEADRALLARIAALAGGRSYVCKSGRPLPQVFARETALAGRVGLFEGDFTPQMLADSSDPLLRGIARGELPRLRGHVVTAAKPLARTVLSRATQDGQDPILAYWQVGLGRSVAFTSGMWSRWGTDWLAWHGFERFWTQLIRWTARPVGMGPFTVQSSLDGDRVQLVVEAADSVGANAIPHIELHGAAISPSFTPTPLTFVQVAPRRFQTSFTADAAGSYVVNVGYRVRGDVPAGEQTGLFRTVVTAPYPREYRDLSSNEALLREVARITNGRVLDPRLAPTVFEQASIRPIVTKRPIWDDFVRFALFLFLIDVAVRRIAIRPRAAAQSLRRWVAEHAPPAPDTAAATLGALRDAQGQRASQSKTSEPVRTTPAAPPRVDETAPARDVKPAAPPRKVNDYLARLRNAKRRARESAEGEDGGDDAGN